MTAQELQNYIGKLFFLEGSIWWINKKFRQQEFGIIKKKEYFY